MKATHKLLTLLILGLILIGCEKWEKAKPTTVTGQVRTYGTEEAIRHTPVKVQIVEERYSTAWGAQDSYRVLAETWTDEGGRFSLSEPLYSNVEYYLAVDESTVKESQGYIPPTYSSITYPERKIYQRGGTVNMNYYLGAYGWVRFHFLSENPQPGDIYGYNLGGGASETFYGSVDQYRTWDFYGNVTHEIALNKYQGGVWENWQIPFFVSAFDTVDLEIKF